MTSAPTRKLSVLLASAGYGGTIAAVRSLGAGGIDVGVISSSRPSLAAAAWSRYASRKYVAPLESDSRRFLERLIEIGAGEPGQILLPTSDQTAWLYAEHSAELGRFFRLYHPPLETMRRILDKKLFANAATQVGLAVLPSWEPRTLDDLAAIAPGLPYPILIKRRTHVHHATNDKGVVIRSQDQMLQQYERFVNREKRRYGQEAVAEDFASLFLQQFVSVLEEGVCSVSGFVDRTGELFVTRRSTKVFQRSQPVGVGVCFESLPADENLSSAVRRLCKELGYFGIFETEFIRHDDSWAIIDFNPRLFNQIGLEVRRGMPLPLLACLDAAGETDALRDAVSGAMRETDSSSAVFCDGFTLRAILMARRLTARISREEFAYWRGWMKKHAADVYDVAKDPRDPGPAYMHALSEILLGIKAIPKFLRVTPRTTARARQASAEARR